MIGPAGDHVVRRVITVMMASSWGFGGDWGKFMTSLSLKRWEENPGVRGCLEATGSAGTARFISLGIQGLSGLYRASLVDAHINRAVEVLTNDSNCNDFPLSQSLR